MLRAAALPCRPQALPSQTSVSGACSSCFISRSWDPTLLWPLRDLVPSSWAPVLPFSSFLLSSGIPPSPKFLPIPTRHLSSPRPCPPSLLFVFRLWPPNFLIPTLSLPLPPDPSLLSSTPICFSSAQPRPITSFLYLSPDSQCLPRPPPRGSAVPGSLDVARFGGEDLLPSHSALDRSCPESLQGPHAPTVLL